MGKAEYNTENCNGFSISEMLSLFRTHETVTFVLPGLGMTEAETVLFKNAIAELERLAEIGRATEKAFELGLSINTLHSVLSKIDYFLFNSEELLEWAKERGE